jgi:hypothetical protein
MSEILTDSKHQANTKQSPSKHQAIAKQTPIPLKTYRFILTANINNIYTKLIL